MSSSDSAAVAPPTEAELAELDLELQLIDVARKRMKFRQVLKGVNVMRRLGIG